VVIKPVVLVGAALHTRKFEPGQDYDWYVKTGELQLFDQMEDIHRVMLRDVGGEAPILAVIVEEQGVGFLIGELACQRQDHAKRVIHDTLYLEFDTEFCQSVLQAAAILLLRIQRYYKPYKQYFSNYAEILFSTPQFILKTVKLPSATTNQAGLIEPSILGEKWVFFSNAKNRYRCARKLVEFVYSGEGKFLFVSTGRVNLEKCRKLADKSDECILLTLSSEVESEVNLKKERHSKTEQIYGFLKSRYETLFHHRRW